MSIETPYAIGIQVATQYLDEESVPEHNRFVFAYTIRIENRAACRPSCCIATGW